MRTDRANRIISKTALRFKELRQKRNLSHEMLAEKAGITRPAISHIENGKRRPSLLLCLKLAKALDTRLSDILDDIEQEIK